MLRLLEGALTGLRVIFALAFACPAAARLEALQPADALD